jgi:A/G-specific adenine glycosylase
MKNKKPASAGFLLLWLGMKLLPELKKFYKENKRDLPWRKTRDPYKILVSEVMLQQTQVERVLPKYKAFLREFPSAKVLAGAPLSKVLKQWQGLGYNRRGKFLHEAAKVIVKEGWGGKLPGVGPYTRAAIEAFAFNRATVFIETNIRTVFFYHAKSVRLSLTEKVADADLLPLVEGALKESKMEPRDFYAALMDYGSHLKRSGIKINSQSKHYTKQKKFEGSERQIRGAILREVLKKPQTLHALSKILKVEKEKAAQLLARLVAEGLLKKEESRYSVAD